MLSPEANLLLLGCLVLAATLVSADPKDAHVSILRRNKVLCGGSLVANRNVITAASCLDYLFTLRPEDPKLTVRFDQTGQRVKVERVSIINRFKSDSDKYASYDDIAMLLLAEEVKKATPLKLPIKDLEVEPYVEYELTKNTPNLTTIAAFSETEADCDLDLSIAKTERELKKDTSFCTKSADCKAARLGDPVTKDDVVLGVVSRLPTGEDCLTEPMVNTRVSKFLDYVNEELTTFTQNPADKSKLAKSIYIENDGEQTLCQYFFGWLLGEDSEEDDDENEVDGNEDAEDEDSEEDYLDIFGLFGNALRRP
ncbi:uncharacterized protein LOC106654999 [Trichogramma pretiosum]|uniref:uncharacterized protein LOC106654999 n=1 Tax=Trichogramma pretiosum TaxID=7493 RepID=UPI0006C950D8|nr:uncharacterized protein LOC106654999 [Trichogramma pretiosum]